MPKKPKRIIKKVILKSQSTSIEIVKTKKKKVVLREISQSTTTEEVKIMKPKKKKIVNVEKLVS